MEYPKPHTAVAPPDLTAEVGLAGLVEKQLNRYINADRQTLPPSGLYDRVIHEVERPLLRLVLNLVAGNKMKAAHILGLNRNTLLKKLRLHGLVDVTPRQTRRTKKQVRT
jgi:two-component system nitrogen regulation response regulator GlnG